MTLSFRPETNIYFYLNDVKNINIYTNYFVDMQTKGLKCIQNYLCLSLRATQNERKTDRW